jgi:hypothetical protein
MWSYRRRRRRNNTTPRRRRSQLGEPLVPWTRHEQPPETMASPPSTPASSGVVPESAVVPASQIGVCSHVPALQRSLVHELASSQSSGEKMHCIVVESQRSLVHASLSLQSVFAAQQPAIASWWHISSVPHVSVVHVLESAQSPSVRQQPVIVVIEHVPPTHDSFVQRLPSLQSPSLLQQPAIGVKTQRFVVGLHAFDVHALASTQSVA